MYAPVWLRAFMWVRFLTSRAREMLETFFILSTESASRQDSFEVSQKRRVLAIMGCQYPNRQRF